MTWLKCVVSPGSFSNERAILFKDFDGKDHLIFGTLDCLLLVSVVHGENWLRVEVLEKRYGYSLVQLPRETIDCVRTVTVDSSQLEE